MREAANSIALFLLQTSDSETILSTVTYIITCQIGSQLIIIYTYSLKLPVAFFKKYRTQRISSYLLLNIIYLFFLKVEIKKNKFIYILEKYVYVEVMGLSTWRIKNK